MAEGRICYEGLLINSAVFDDEGAGAVLGEFFVVSDDDEGGVVLLGELEKHIHDLLAVAGVEIAGWLIGEDDFRAIDECAGDGDALLLAA